MCCGFLGIQFGFALLAMWIDTTAAVTEHHYGTADAASAACNEGANWVGILLRVDDHEERG